MISTGKLRDSDRSDHDVGGADRVTVAKPPVVRPRPTATPTATPSSRTWRNVHDQACCHVHTYPTTGHAHARAYLDAYARDGDGHAYAHAYPDGHAYAHAYPDGRAGAGGHSYAYAETSVNRRHSATLAGPADDPRFATGHRRSAVGWESAP